MLDVSAQCTITPTHPTTLTATGGAVVSGTTNVMIQCVCPVTSGHIVRWYNTHRHILLRPYYQRYAAGSPYFTSTGRTNVTLVIPKFNECYIGTYYCGIYVTDNSLGQPSNNVTLTIGKLIINIVSYLYVGI